MCYTKEEIQQSMDIALEFPEKTNLKLYMDDEGEVHWRFDIGGVKGRCEGTLNFEGWSTVDIEGYYLHEYFRQGEYIGPDRYGVHPVFRVK